MSTQPFSDPNMSAGLNAATPIQAASDFRPQITAMAEAPPWLLNHPNARLELIDGQVEFVFVTVCETCRSSLKACYCGSPKVAERLAYNHGVGLNQKLIDTLIASAANAPKSGPAPAHTPKANIAVILQTLARRYKPGQIIELRIPGVTKGDRKVTLGGLYTDHERLAADVAEVVRTTDAPAIYTGLQEINDGPAYVAEITNRIEGRSNGAGASEITWYRWLLIDIDAVRPEGFKKASTTDEEKLECLAVLNDLIEYFAEKDITGDVIDSGNSYHFVLMLDLEANKETEALIKKVLESLAVKFDKPGAQIDTGVYDRPRICKLPGTPARKGSDTAERPHRWSSIISEAKDAKPVPLEWLLKIAELDKIPEPVKQIAAPTEDIRKSMDFVRGFCDWAGLEYLGERPHEGGIITPLESFCPFEHKSGHHSNECHVGVNQEAKCCFACKHDSCTGRGWKEFRAQIESIHGEGYISDPVVLSGKTRQAVVSALSGSTKVDSNAVADVTPVGTEPINTQPVLPITKKLELTDILKGELLLTERGVADIFDAHFGEDYLFSVVKKRGEWMRWNGQIWVVTTEGKMREKAKAISRIVHEKLIPTTESDSERNAFKKLANKLDTMSFVTNAFRYLEGAREVQFSDFDRQPGLFNFLNGTYDLDRQEFRPFRREDLLTQMAGVAYRPEATCPMFLKFLENSFPSQPVREYLHRWFGYCLTGTGAEKASPIFHGLGDNGKTVLLDIIVAIFGSYGDFCPWSTFATAKWGGTAIRNDLARLHNLRLVVCDESSKTMELDEAVFKMATGNSAIVSRFLNKEYFSYVAGFKLIMATNNRPKIVGGDDATWARVHDIPMDQQFKVGDPRRIENLKAILMAEREGIAAWIVEGYKKYRQAGGLKPPTEILRATADYKQHSDIQGEFFIGQCDQGEGLSIKLTDLYSRHKNWSVVIGENQLTLQEFTEVVESRGYRLARRMNEQGRPQYVCGVGVLGATTESVPDVSFN